MTPRIDRAERPRLRRRDFLAAGAGLVAFPAFAGWTGAAGIARGPLQVGFCDAPPNDAEAAVPMVAADRLKGGDPRLVGRGARVTVHGLVGDAESLPALGVRSTELRVGFPAAELRAWTYRLLPVWQEAPPNAFRVPVDRGLALACEVETAFGSERFETVLSTGREPGVPKLRAGHYLIAPGADELPLRRFDPARSGPMIAFSVEPFA